MSLYSKKIETTSWILALKPSNGSSRWVCLNYDDYQRRARGGPTTDEAQARAMGTRLAVLRAIIV